MATHKSSELQIELAYRTPLQKLCLFIVFSLFLVWGAAAPLAGLFFLVGSPGLSALLLGFSAVGYYSLWLFWDERFTVNKDGLRFPGIFCSRLNFRCQRKWDDVASMKLLKKGDTASFDDKLVIFFKSGGAADLDLSQFRGKKSKYKGQDKEKEPLEQFLLALEVWAPQAEKDVDVMLLQNNLHDQKGQAGEVSYTQMWEDEMNRRFTATSFVPLQPGKVLQGGRLKVLKQLAFGGLSAIYLAQLNNTEALVLKEAVTPTGTDDALQNKALEMFRREADLLKRLHHPHIARVLDHFVEDGRNYLLLQYVPGDDLRQVVKTAGPQSAKRVLEWCHQIVEVLCYLHSQEPPVLHRDLTPDNIVLSNNGEVTIIDFGAANEFVGTATGTLVGKQSYISPEQFRGNATTQSDLYALGATMFFLLTAKDPEPLSQSSPISVNPGLAPGINSLVESLTCFDDEQRIKTAQQAMTVIEQLLAGSVATH